MAIGAASAAFTVARPPSPLSAASPGRALVVGAGISGLTAALRLAQGGVAVEVWEEEPAAGGLLRPVPFCGVGYDRGSHRLHSEGRVAIDALTDRLDWQARPRRGVLVLGDRRLPYPPRLLAYVRSLGLGRMSELGFHMLRHAVSHRWGRSWEGDRTANADATDIGFADFVRARVGDATYEDLYRPSAEKVWGLPPTQLSQAVAKQRLSTTRPWTAVTNRRRATPRRFFYPRRGMGSLVANVKQQAIAAGVRFVYRQRFDLSAAAQWPSIFYSGHVDQLVAAESLAHRGLYLLYLALADTPDTNAPETSPDTYYVPAAGYWFGRVSAPERFSPALRVAGRRILVVEIPEGRWGADHDFCGAAAELMAQLGRAGILAGGERLLEIEQCFVPRVYPMYRRGWLTPWRSAMARVAQLGNVYPIGRQGLYLHCNIDHCVEIAGAAAAHALAGGSAASWLGAAERYLELRVRD